MDEPKPSVRTTEKESAMASQQRASQSEVRFRPRRLGHAAIWISDGGRSTEFYNKVCGLEVVRWVPSTKASSVSNGNTHHDLGINPMGVVPGPRTTPGVGHLGWEMENEVELVAAYQRAVDAGVKIDAAKDYRVSKGVFLQDPEGNGIEFYTDITKQWRQAWDGLKEVYEWTPGNPPPSPEPNYPVDPEIRRVEDAVFHVKCLSHAAMVASDFDLMLRFYTEVAGLEVLFRGLDRSFVLLGGTLGGPQLALVRSGPGQSLGLHHLGFLVDDERDLRKSQEGFTRAGIEPQLQLDHATKRSVFLRDPDDLLLELYSERERPLSELGGLDPGLVLHLA